MTGRAAALAGWGISAAVHGAMLGAVWLAPAERPPRGEAVAVEIEEVRRPPPPAPPEERPAREAPRPPPP
ncbi:MAG TPA: hypothetical protein VH880_06190, partial [Anaeromyxobacteraceae bacterium]